MGDTWVGDTARGGSVRLRLYYHLKWSWPMHKGVLVQEEKLEIAK